MMTIILLSLNVIDVFSTLYATRFLGFVELNPLAVNFPIWLSILKFGACAVPLICAYELEKMKMRNYLPLPFLTSSVMIEFYVLVVTSNILNILKA